MKSKCYHVFRLCGSFLRQWPAISPTATYDYRWKLQFKYIVGTVRRKTVRGADRGGGCGGGARKDDDLMNGLFTATSS